MALLHDTLGNALNTFKAADTYVAMNPAANTGGTLTLSAPGAGLFHYIAHLRIARTATAALAGTAALTITTTNLNGAPSFVVGNAMAIGATQVDFDQDLMTPFKSQVANTATTFVFPAPGAGVLWSVFVAYFVAP